MAVVSKNLFRTCFVRERKNDATDVPSSPFPFFVRVRRHGLGSTSPRSQGEEGEGGKRSCRSCCSRSRRSSSRHQRTRLPSPLSRLPSYHPPSLHSFHRRPQVIHLTHFSSPNHRPLHSSSLQTPTSLAKEHRGRLRIRDSASNSSNGSSSSSTRIHHHPWSRSSSPIWVVYAYRRQDIRVLVHAYGFFDFAFDGRKCQREREASRHRRRSEVGWTLGRGGKEFAGER